MLLSCCLGACQSNRDATLAEQGRIDADAALVVHVRIAIAAPPSQVWALLADIRRWPRWQPDIESVSIAAPPAPGVRFAWTTGRGTIRSLIAVFQPGQRLVWTGRLFWVRAIHAWTLSASPSGGTIASCDESLDGWGIGWLMRLQDLADTDRRWLAALRKAAEGRAEHHT